jgi:hypothetical protein
MAELSCLALEMRATCAVESFSDRFVTSVVMPVEVLAPVPHTLDTAGVRHVGVLVVRVSVGCHEQPVVAERAARAVPMSTCPPRQCGQRGLPKSYSG